MTVYEILCLLNPSDGVTLVDSRDLSTLYDNFNYTGLVRDLPFRPDVFNHSVYQISTKNGLEVYFNKRGLATGIRIFDILCLLDKSQKISICSEFSERFLGTVSELEFDSSLCTLRVESLRVQNGVLVIEYFVKDSEISYKNFRVL